MEAEIPPEALLLKVLHRIDPGSRLAGVRPLEGGSSTTMSLLEFVRPDKSRGRIVFRQCGPVNLLANPDSAETEFRLLNRLSSLGLAVPRALLHDRLGDPIGTPWLVLDHCPGEPRWAPCDAHDNAIRMADFLARLHTIEPGEDLLFVPRQVIPDFPDDTTIRKLRLDLPGRIEARWPPPSNNGPRLLHGDYWPGNVLWQENRLAVVVDWEDAMVGDPLADLAIARSNLVWSHGPGPCRAFTSRYAERTGFDLDGLWLWDIHAAWAMAPHAAEYASGWKELGRPDITEDLILERLQDLGRSFFGS